MGHLADRAAVIPKGGSEAKLDPYGNTVHNTEYEVVPLDYTSAILFKNF